MSVLEEEIKQTRRLIGEWRTFLASQESKLECLEKFERDEQEAKKARMRQPKPGFCMFDSNGLPLLWTVREKPQDVERKWKQYKPYAPYEKQGFTIGPCVVKPVIKMGGEG